MSFLGVFHYSNISQRRIVYYNVVLSALLAGYLITCLIFTLNGYLLYYPLNTVILIIAGLGFLAGNLAGTYVYRKTDRYRMLYMISDILFIMIPAVYFLSGLLPVSGDPISTVIIEYPPAVPALLFVWTGIAGMKSCYVLKISSGDFIDEKQGIFRILVLSLLGVAVGILVNFIHLFHDINPYAAVISLLILPSIFIIDLPYSPSPFYTEDYDEEKHASNSFNRRDNLIFTYLNILFIVIYIFFGHLSIEKFYGGFSHVAMVFIAVTAAALIAGMVVGRFLNQKNWYIYSGSLFPVFFFLFLLILFDRHDTLQFWSGILLFIPAAAVFGFSLYNTIKNIIDNYDHSQRFRILVFSVIIIPVPVLAGLALVSFSNFWFFMLLYALAAVNILLPAIYMINKNIETYKKIIYFTISLFFVPVLILIHLYFQVPLDDTVYTKRIKNFEILQNVNYNANFIKAKDTVYLNRYPVFTITDSIIRNMKRGLVPISLYIQETEHDKVLFVDGNQKFFRNPVIGFFENSRCIDTVPERMVDYQRLPFSGTQTYVPDEKPLYFFMLENRNEDGYRVLVDIPNIFDQNQNYFRFSYDYYKTLKGRLSDDGIFVQVFNVPGCRREIMESSLEHIEGLFSEHVLYLFSNILVIMASDQPNAFTITEDAYENLSEKIRDSEELGSLFYNELHVLSHIVPGGIGTFQGNVKTGQVNWHFLPSYLLNKSIEYRIPKPVMKEYFEDNSQMLSFINEERNGAMFIVTAKNAIAMNDSILTLLKKTEMAEAREKFEAEMGYLRELKKTGEYNVYLRDYLSGILSYKEDYYYTTALRLESERKWEEAKKLYHAILAMNKNNFNANYRLGLLYITLQDIDKSFNYLQQAMRLKPNNPKVLYQMGVHLFSTGKMSEAITYFKQALAQDEKSAAIYKYLAMCYDNLGDYYRAEQYFSKSLIEDPNDLDTKSRLKSVQEKIEKERSQWDMPERKNEFEVEQDAEMPLPVSKSAYDVRLKDEDKSLPLIDPITGEVIENDNEQSE